MNAADAYRKIRFSEALNATSVSALEWDLAASFANNQLVLGDLANHAIEHSLLVHASEEITDLMDAAQLLSQDIKTEVLSECVNINNAMVSTSVTPVFLKGAAILLAQYEDYPGSRLVSDIDLLVSIDDLDAAVVAMETMGYRFSEVVPRPIQAYWSSRHIPPMTSRDATWSVEIHIHPIKSLPALPIQFTTEQVIERSVVVEINESPLRIPSKEDLMFHSFYHSAVTDGYLLAGIDTVRAYLDTRFLLASLGLEPANLINVLDTYNRSSRRLLKSLAHKYCDRYAVFIGGSTNFTQSDRQRSALARFAAGLLTRSTVQKWALRGHYGIRGVIHLWLKSTRLERAVMRSANPDDFRYLPVTQQFLNPFIIWTRFKRVFNKVQ